MVKCKDTIGNLGVNSQDPKSGINPVLDAQKYRVFHVPEHGSRLKLRLFYKTRNVSACFDGIFGGIGYLRGIPGRRIGAG